MSAPVPEDTGETTTAILALVASGTARTRVGIARSLGVAASTVTLKVGQLLDAGLLEEGGWDAPSGGRRARLLRVVPRSGRVLAASMGRHHARVGSFDVQGGLVGALELPIEMGAPPERLLSRIVDGWEELVGDLATAGVRGIGLSLPGPVDPGAATAVQPSTMPGWNGWRIATWFRQELGCTVLVDNDANMSALGEHARRRTAGDAPLGTLLHVKAGTGLGGGLVLQGRLHRGATWLGGDIAHVRIPGEERPCACGNRGCLETVVSGLALVSAIAEAAPQVTTPSALLDLAATGDPEAMTLLRTAGGTLGETLATLVNFINPDLVTIGGSLSRSPAFLAQIQAKLYESCHPLATRDLRIEASLAGADAEITGIAQLVLRRAVAAPPHGAAHSSISHPRSAEA